MTGRTTQGVILAKLKDSDDAFTSAAVVVRSDEDEADGIEVVPPVNETL